MDLTKYACEGFEAKPNVHLFSSPAYYAHALGAHFFQSGRSTPRDVRMGRGYSIRANDMRFTIADALKSASGRPSVTFERIE